MNYSITSVAALCALLVSSSGCYNGTCISGNGKQVTQTRSVAEFSGVEASGSIKVIMKQDSVQSVKITADENILEHIGSEVSHGTLHLGTKRGSFCNTGPITVYLTAKNFSGLAASGAVEAVSEGKINANNFDLDLSGSNRIQLDLNAADVRTSGSGSSAVTLTGQARSHSLDLSGSADIDALNFVVGEYNIKSSGASKSRINVLKSLRISSSGSSEVVYRGNPSIVNNDHSGSSSVKKVD